MATANDPPAGPGPVPTGQRVDTLDVLRGFALLGILLVNIELFRGPAFYDLLAGQAPATTPTGEVAHFAVGWLVNGKFLSSFALLFGVGAAIMAGRAAAAGTSPRGLLARRYVWLAVFGLAHMVLLFSGDILFVYGLAGLLLLPFVPARPRTVLWWAGGIIAAYTLVMAAVGVLGAAVESPASQATGDDPAMVAVEGFIAERRDAAVAAYTDGSVGEQLRARAWEALLVQGGQLLMVPWVLAVFLLGFAAARTGMATDPGGHRRRLARIAVVGLVGGLVVNLPLGWFGPLGSGGAGPEAGGGMVLALLGPVAQMAGAPLLAAGYLAALALACQHPAVRARLAPLRDAGRMALSAYVLQSVLATGFFVGLGYYGALSAVQALGVVVAIWAVMLAACMAWQRQLGRGPLERLWRRLTYGGVGPRARTVPGG